MKVVWLLYISSYFAMEILRDDDFSQLIGVESANDTEALDMSKVYDDCSSLIAPMAEKYDLTDFLAGNMAGDEVLMNLLKGKRIAFSDGRSGLLRFGMNGDFGLFIDLGSERKMEMRDFISGLYQGEIALENEHLEQMVLQLWEYFCLWHPRHQRPMQNNLESHFSFMARKDHILRNPVTGRNIKGPQKNPRFHQEKKESLIELRKRFVAQYELLAKIAHRISDYVGQNPRASYFEVRDFIFDEEEGFDNGILSTHQIVLIKRSIRNYVEGIRRVSKTMDELKSEPRAKIERYFGMKAGGIKGRLSVMNLGDSMSTVFFDREDFNSAYRAMTSADMNRDPGNAEGFTPNRIPGNLRLNGIMSVVRAKAADTIFGVLHERQHLLNKYFDPLYPPVYLDRDDFLIYCAEKDLKDELIAYTGLSASDDRLSLLEEGLMADFEKSPLPDRIEDPRKRESLLRRYRIKIKKAIAAMRRLRDAGGEGGRFDNASGEDIVIRGAADGVGSDKSQTDGKIDSFLLAVAPMEHWGMIADEREESVNS